MQRRRRRTRDCNSSHILRIVELKTTIFVTNCQNKVFLGERSHIVHISQRKDEVL